MSTQEPILETKRRISTALLDTPGISGVGLRGGRVVVYVESDDPKLQQQATAIARRIAPDITLLFEQTGAFGPQGTG